MTIAANVSRILDNARVQLPGAIDDALKLELFNVLNDFFHQSNAWRNVVTVNATAGVGTYTLTPTDTDSIILKLVSLVDHTIGSGVQATMGTPGTLVLAVVPSSAATYDAEISLTVKDADGDGIPICPSWFFDTYGEGFISGLLGRMMAQPAKAYTNERLSILHMRKFRNVIGVARADANRKNLYRAQAWLYPRAWAVRRRGGSQGFPQGA